MDKETKLALLKWCLEQALAMVESMEAACDAGEIEHDYKEALCLVFERGIESVRWEIKSMTC